MSTTIGTAEIAEMLGVSREHVTNRVTKRKDFPAPSIALTQRMRRWKEADVRAWIARQSKRAAMSEADSR